MYSLTLCGVSHFIESVKLAIGLSVRLRLLIMNCIGLLWGFNLSSAVSRRLCFYCSFVTATSSSVASYNIHVYLQSHFYDFLSAAVRPTLEGIVMPASWR